MAGREASLPDRAKSPLPDRAANRPASFGRATTGTVMQNGTVTGREETAGETLTAAMGKGTATDRETTGLTGPALKTGNPRWPADCW